MADNDQQVVLPTGGLAPRCTARSKSTGRRCGKAAREGYSVCSVHGAGTKVREEEGTRRPPGGQIKHGLYSRTAPATLAELRAEVAATAIDLDNSDDEMRTIKAMLAYLFSRASWLESQATMLERAVEAVATTMAAAPVSRGIPGVGEVSVAQARQMAADLASARLLLSNITSFAYALIDSNARSIVASKDRATTKAAKAQAQAMEQFVSLTQRMRQLLNELAPSPEWQDTFEFRLAREIMGPARLELPEVHL